MRHRWLKRIGAVFVGVSVIGWFLELRGSGIRDGGGYDYYFWFDLPAFNHPLIIIRYSAIGLVFLLLASGCWALKAALDRRDAARVERGMCAVCGYDLRFTPNRCPECGAEGDATRTL